MVDEQRGAGVVAGGQQVAVGRELGEGGVGAQAGEGGLGRGGAGGERGDFLVLLGQGGLVGLGGERLVLRRGKGGGDVVVRGLGRQAEGFQQ